MTPTPQKNLFSRPFPFLAALAFGLLSSLDCPAQSPDTQGKKTQDASAPRDAVARFFAALTKNQIEDAYAGLLKGSIILEKSGGEAETIKSRTQKAIDNYGPVRYYVTLDETAVCAELRRITCLSLNEDFPMRWRFFFYEGAEGWKLVDLRVDDAVVDMFEGADAAAKKTKSR